MTALLAFADKHFVGLCFLIVVVLVVVCDTWASRGSNDDGDYC